MLLAEIGTFQRCEMMDDVGLLNLWYILCYHNTTSVITTFVYIP